MKDIFTVAKFTAKDMLSRRSFRISTLFILILIVLGCNVPNIINTISGGEGFEDTILISDQDNVFQNQLSRLAEQDTNGTKIKVENLDKETIKTQIRDGEITSALIISKPEDNPGYNLEYVVKNLATAGQAPETLLQSLKDLYTNLQLHKLGLSEKQIASITPAINVSAVQAEETEISGNVLVMMIMSIVLFYAIYFCAYQVSSSITVEKTSKIIETLVTSTSPSNIVIGKTLGIGVVGLLQMILFVATALISAKLFLPGDVLATVLDMSTITPYLGFITIIYFILGYATFALIYALTGSTVNKPEDIQSANTPVALLSMFGFYLAYFTLTDPTSSINLFAAIFPISSPFCMPIRIMMGIASGWEVIISIAVLLITILIIARVAIKIYSDAILNYGTKLSLSELFKIYKQK